VHFITFIEQKFRQVTAILSGDAGDQGGFHAASSERIIDTGRPLYYSRESHASTGVCGVMGEPFAQT